MLEIAEWNKPILQCSLIIVPLLLWFLFCLFAVNWKKARSALVEGAWIPLALIVVLVALVWSQVRPSELTLLGVVTVGTFWWQAVAIALVVGIGLFAGWIQDRYSLTPFEVSVEPPDHGHEHGHEHGHGHDHAHH